MQTIRPENLTTRELVQQAWLIGADQLPAYWAEELLKRLERLVDLGTPGRGGPLIRNYDAQAGNCARTVLNILDAR